jgi:hypothetical protein
MSESRVPNLLVEQFRKGAIPRDLRLLAAQGALPLTTADLADLLHHLTGDREPEVRSTAAASLRQIPAGEMLPVVKDRLTSTGVLDWVLTQREERELREVALQNPSTSDDAIQSLAGSLHSELAELVVINQVRLLRRTSLLEALEVNPNLSNDQKRRLRELRETFKVGLAPEAPPAPAPEPAPAEEPAPVPEEAIVDTPVTEDEALVRYLAEDERAEPEKVGVVQRIYRLNTAEKVITALKGTREERSILVRDPNRIVASAVLGSPRLTDSEVESFAGMKSLSAEVLRQIGGHREWTRRYGVICALVKNPRTPIGVSLGMVSRLNPRDLKGISVDRNVPEVIRKQAQKFIKGPQQAKG